MTTTEVAAAPAGSDLAVMPNLYDLQKQSDFGDKRADEVFGQGFNFLPRLQLFGGSSNEVKEGKVPIGTYGIVKFGEEEIIQVGKTILVSPLAYRTKAMFLKTIDGKPTSYFDVNSPEFKDVVEKANRDGKSGNVYGPEFLMWTGPQHGFVTFFCNNITMRNEAPAVRALCPRADGSWKTGVLSAILIKKEAENQSWHGPKITVSGQQIERPDPSTVEVVMGTFLKPVASQPKPPVIAAPAEAVQTDR